MKPRAECKCVDVCFRPKADALETGGDVYYIDVEWRHELPPEPIRLASEIDAHRMEIRKLEFFRGGSVGWA